MAAWGKPDGGIFLANIEFVHQLALIDYFKDRCRLLAILVDLDGSSAKYSAEG